MLRFVTILAFKNKRYTLFTIFTQEPICYFSFVLDPTNFGATVENMFYSSFLIKEGKAKIYFKKMDENDQHLPYIIPLNKRKVKEGTGNDLDNKKQLLTSISYEEWIRLKVLSINSY